MAKAKMVKKLLLKLYTTGKRPNSELAVADLRQMYEEQFSGQYELRIINVLEHLQLAANEKIFATPILIKELPPTHSPH